MANDRIDDDDRRRFNRELLQHLDDTLEDGQRQVGRLRTKLDISYWALIILSIIMFGLGVTLLVVPIALAIGEPTGKELGASGLAGGLGIADLVALFLLRPINRIHGLMGDMSQITIALNSYQTQVQLRLMEADSRVPATLGSTAERVQEAADKSIKSIEVYFEAKRVRA